MELEDALLDAHCAAVWKHGKSGRFSMILKVATNGTIGFSIAYMDTLCKHSTTKQAVGLELRRKVGPICIPKVAILRSVVTESCREGRGKEMGGKGQCRQMENGREQYKRKEWRLQVFW